MYNGIPVIFPNGADSLGSHIVGLLTHLQEMKLTPVSSYHYFGVTSVLYDQLTKTKDGFVDLSGSSSDNMGVTQVSWSNAATGASGIASGLDSWSISGISLENGENAITVMAIDEAGNTGQAQLSVVRQGGGKNK